jgi:hypothetical protein
MSAFFRANREKNQAAIESEFAIQFASGIC